ncbi:MAG: ATP-binding protein [Thermoplasmata archaeon]
MNNPFIFRKVVAGPNFTGRLNERIEILSTLKNGENVVLFAPRKYGKTSLSRVIVDELMEKGFLASRINAEYILSGRALASAIVGSVHAALYPERKQFFGNIREIMEYFPSLKVRTTDDLPHALNFEGVKLNDVPLLQKSFELFQTLAAKNKKHLLVVIDEFSSVAKNMGWETVQLIQSTIQNHNKVSYIFLVSSKALVGGLSEGGPIYKLGKKVELGPVDKKEFAVFISEKFKKTGVEIDAELINKLLEFTQGHPYYTQQLCHLLWNIASASEGKKIDKGALDYAQKYLMESETGTYKQMLAGLTTNQIKLLVELSKGNKEMYSTGTISKLEMSPSSIQRAFDGLMERESVFKTEEGVFVTDPLFAKFVMHNIKM